MGDTEDKKVEMKKMIPQSIHRASTNSLGIFTKVGENHLDPGWSSERVQNVLSTIFSVFQTYHVFFVCFRGVIPACMQCSGLREVCCCFPSSAKKLPWTTKKESQRLFRTTQNDTITAVGSGDGKSALFTGFQLFQVFLSLVSSAYT